MMKRHVSTLALYHSMTPECFLVFAMCGMCAGSRKEPLEDELRAIVFAKVPSGEQGGATSHGITLGDLSSCTIIEAYRVFKDEEGQVVTDLQI